MSVQWCVLTHHCAWSTRAGDVRWSHLLHRVFLFGDELQRSLEGSFDEQANLSVYELRRRLAVGFLRQHRRRLAAVKGQLTHRLVHTKLDNLKTQHSQADFTQFSKRSTDDLIEMIFLPVRKQTAWLSWGRPAPPWWPAERKPARPLDPQASRTSCQAAALGWRGTVPLVDTVHSPNLSLWGQWTPWREHSVGRH